MPGFSVWPFERGRQTAIFTSLPARNLTKSPGTVAPELEHDREKREPIFGKDHAPAKSSAPLRSNALAVHPMVRQQAGLRCVRDALIAVPMLVGSAGRRPV